MCEMQKAAWLFISFIVWSGRHLTVDYDSERLLEERHGLGGLGEQRAAPRALELQQEGALL